MARLAGTDSSETRARVLAAALRLFAERGRHGCTIRQIGEAAGVTLGTVHHHFGTKNDLYNICMDSMYSGLRSLRDELVQVIQSHERIEDSIEEIVRAAFDFGCEHQLTLRLAFRTVLDQRHLDPVHRDGVQGPMLAQAAALFADATGHSQKTLQLVIQHVVYLIARNAMASDQERLLVTRAENAEAARAMIAQELVRTTRMLMFGTEPPR